MWVLDGEREKKKFVEVHTRFYIGQRVEVDCGTRGNEKWLYGMVIGITFPYREGDDFILLPEKKPDYHIAYIDEYYESSDADWFGENEIREIK